MDALLEKKILLDWVENTERKYFTGFKISETPMLSVYTIDGSHVRATSYLVSHSGYIFKLTSHKFKLYTSKKGTYFNYLGYRDYLNSYTGYIQNK